MGRVGGGWTTRSMDVRGGGRLCVWFVKYAWRCRQSGDEQEEHYGSSLHC